MNTSVYINIDGHFLLVSGVFEAPETGSRDYPGSGPSFFVESVFYEGQDVSKFILSYFDPDYIAEEALQAILDNVPCDL